MTASSLASRLSPIESPVRVFWPDCFALAPISVTSNCRQLFTNQSSAYVACLLNHSQPATLLKIYNQRSYGTARNNACAFTSRGELRLPKLLGSTQSHALLALEWLPGRLLSDALSGVAGECDLRRVGRAIGLLHNQEPDGLPLMTHETQAAEIAEVAHGIGLLCPGLAERARRIAGTLGATLCRLRRRVASIHGDFYSRQVLFTSRTVSILDLDAAARGDPATDIGNFIAYLERDLLRGGRSAGQVEEYGDALIAGYQECASALPGRRIRLYTAAALLRMGLKPFRNREPDWPEMIGALLSRVESLLTERTARRSGSKGKVGTTTETGNRPTIQTGGT